MVIFCASNDSIVDILDKFSSIARARRRFFGCSLITQNEKSMTAFWIGLNPLRDRDVDFFNADRGAVVDHRPLFGRWYVRGFYRLRDRDVDFLDAL